MAITAIPSLFQSALLETNAKPTTAQQPQALTSAAEDTVQLTAAERVFQLYNLGQPISQIAQTLNLTVDQVSIYLNITNVA